MAQSTPLTTYNELFLEALERLNHQQQQAVNTIEGPVMVIAGPGTGKTHILAARIGKILLETDAQAYNILCLTFTDAGVHAMRERLLSFIGPEAHKVHIYTFHSFCNSVIQENLDLFGKHDLEPISALERVEIIRKILDRTPIDHPLKKGKADPYFYESHLADLFQRMKMEHWTATYIHDKVREFLGSISTRKEFTYQVNRGKIKKGNPKTAAIEAVTKRMEQLKAASLLFEAYEQLKSNYRRYDYEDMILWVLDAFKNNESLLRRYQEQYLYFLIDEYQDTNGSQNALINTLIDFWDNPNIFIVGDDDQSIYEFQGARLKNLSDFHQTFSRQLSLIILQQNYRSTQPILDSASILITYNEKRIVHQLKSLNIEKKLLATPKNDSFTNPSIVAYPNRMHENMAILQQLEKLQTSGVNLSEVAIIYARHKQVRELKDMLEKRQIPYNTKRRINILQLPFVQNIRTLLEYLQLEYTRPDSGAHLLYPILHFDFWEIDTTDLAKLTRHLHIVEWKKRPTWRTAIGDDALLQQLEINAPNRLISCAKFLNEWIGAIPNYGVPKLLERIINQSGILKLVLHHQDKAWLLQILKSLTDFVQTEADRNPTMTLKRLLTILDSMDANRLPVEMQQVISTENGVWLTTAHSAKGLEFEYVFLIDCVSDYWEPKNTSTAFRFKFPDTLTLSGEEDALEARRRLFYVAMTRAKKGLYLSYSKQKLQTGKQLQRTIFIEELLSNQPTIEIADRQLSNNELLQAQIIQLSEHKKPLIDLLDTATLNTLLTDFRLSVSSMNSYLRCPISFYYEKVLRVPTLESEAAAFGSAMHNALQRLFEQMMQSKTRTFPNKDKLVNYFIAEMMKTKHHFEYQGFQRRMEMGKRYLADYYKVNIRKWKRSARLEFTIKNVEVDGVPLTGTIDRIDLIKDMQAHLIDYKTGSHNASKTAKPSKRQPYGGSYWRQLAFYKILFENYRNNPRRVSQTEIAYLEPNLNGDFITKKLQFSGDDIALVRELIKDTYQKIQAHQFSKGCGEPNCTWCNFAKNQQTQQEMRDKEIELLDD